MTRRLWQNWTRFERPSEVPLIGVTQSAIFSADRRLRWLLTRHDDGLHRGRGAPPLPRRSALFVLANPSRASHDVDDRTVQQTAGFASSWDYLGFEIANTCPVVASRPTDLGPILASIPRPIQIEMILENQRIIRDAAARVDCVIAAWGQLPAPEWVLATLHAVADRPLYCLAWNDDGSPRHPYARGRARFSQAPTLKRWPTAAIDRYHAGLLQRPAHASRAEAA